MLTDLLNPLRIGAKAIKYFVDSTFRDKVVPVPGSVLYCDLWVGVEHSGIHIANGDISNIEVEGFADSAVFRCSAASFTSKSVMGRQIYVSCDRDGPVGDTLVASQAESSIGNRHLYSLLFNNCHHFSARCVDHASPRDRKFAFGDLFAGLMDETWEWSLSSLKRMAERKLGATKWRLWDWNADAGDAPPPAPDWQAQADFFRHLKLDAGSIERVRGELAEMQAYEAEIADERIPADVSAHLAAFRTALAEIDDSYRKHEAFLGNCPGAGFSYADLQACGDEFEALAAALRDNVQVRELARKLGRNHISEEKKKQTRVPRASRNEVHGTHRSDDLMRMLPSELLNLEDDTLESLFYARLLEKNLLSYELRGHDFVNIEQTDISKKRTGPVVACLDTSGSMGGAPLLKAKALLLAIANILEREDRSLHVLLFGDAGQLREYALDTAGCVPGLLRFLGEGFGGGTDYETPLHRAFDIIATQPDYLKADVLMVSDGDCHLSSAFLATMKSRKVALDCSVYSVLCAGTRVEDDFSDTVVVL